MPEYSKQEQKAIAHIERHTKLYGDHNVTGCPRFCRSMCKYTSVIKKLEAKGYKPPNAKS